MIQDEKNVRVGPDMGSDQAAQVFIRFCLEKLQEWRLNNIYGKGAPLLDSPQGDFHPPYSLIFSCFTSCTVNSPAPSHRWQGTAGPALGHPGAIPTG